MTQRIPCADGHRREPAVTAALAAVRRGDLVLIPTESVYALATDAFSARGMSALRDAKGYDADAIRADLAERNIKAIIPGRSNRRVKIEHDRAL